MAVITPTFRKLRGASGGIEATMVIWGPMANGDTGKPVQLPAAADRSIQVEGTFGVGGSVACQGSNDSTIGTDGNFRALSNPAGTTIAITAAGLQQVTEATGWVRPAVTAGDGTTALTVTMCMRRSVR
jgi:hypothetical protein